MTPKLELELSAGELGELIDHLLPFSIYRLGVVQEPGALSKEQFLETYSDGKCYAWTREPVETVEVDAERVIYKPKLPVVQFRSGEFSYPQFFEDPNSRKMCRVKPDMPNFELFKLIRRWGRKRRHAN